jgi:hypothetical protein
MHGIMPATSGRDPLFPRSGRIRRYDAAVRILPRALVPRVLAKLEPIRAWFALAVAMRRHKPTELWLGDSHALCFNSPISLAMFLRTPDGQFVVRFGARLMYSISKNGIPEKILRVARFVGRFGRPGSIVPIISAGEIDIRCHLPDREPDYSFVQEYVDQVAAMIETTKAPRGYIVVPPPPNVDCPSVELYPIKGTIEQRVEAFRGMRAALIDAVESHPKVGLLDFTDVLGNPDGTMIGDLSDDGCHTNPKGISVVRARVDELDLGRVGASV